MHNVNLIGEKVINKNGEIFTVISVDLSDKITIVLDDGKKGYDLTIAIPKKTVRFVSNNVQSAIEKKLYELNEIQKKNIEKINEVEYRQRRILAEAASLFKGKDTTTDLSYSPSYNYSVLEFGKTYGKVALYIYDSCCRNLNFRRILRDSFMKRRLLFATNATPEGYSVWMLPHSNLTGDASNCWANVIEGDIIYEAWNIMEDYGNNNAHRVTFVKQGNGEYVFMGVYQLERVKTINEVIDGVYIKKLKTYKRISTTYRKSRTIICYG